MTETQEQFAKAVNHVQHGSESFMANEWSGHPLVGQSIELLLELLAFSHKNLRKENKEKASIYTIIIELTG